MQTLYTLGSNGSGQLGIGHTEDVSVPKPAIFHPDPPTSPIVKVAAGGNHTLLLTGAGELFWSGDAASGACGVGSLTDIPVFQKMVLTKETNETPPVASMIAATWEASFVVVQDKVHKNTEIYSLGIGNKGELGLGEFLIRTPTATKIKDFPPPDTEIIDISACMGHVVVVLNNGEAYGWGNCRKGQIGGIGAVTQAPHKVEDVNFKIKRVVCAKETTCFFGEPSSGSIRVLGSDKWNLVSDAPKEAPSWLDVGASWGNIYILTTENTLVSWGRNDHGQLPPSNLPLITAIAIGSEHVIAQTQQNEVLAWGWGEHGNCGPRAANNGSMGRWNVIASSKYLPPESRIDTIGAGCATSWILIINT